HAASAGMRIAATLYERTGPAASVSGAKARASAGVVTAHARFSPLGAQIACETNGFSPWRIACGHQAKAQTNAFVSLTRSTSSWRGWRATELPKNASAAAAYAVSAAAAWVLGDTGASIGIGSGRYRPAVALGEAFRAAIRAALPADAVISEPEQLRTYECDALTGHRAVPELVLLPGIAAQVQAIVAICNLHEAPFVARGAGTGLSGR